MKKQLTSDYIKELEKQQYIIVGSHSAVKTCGWTKNMLRGKGGCYKFKFYGIRSHQCLQMTTSASCANRCEFCWRGYKSPVSKDWEWDVDDPDFIIDNSLKAQEKLLNGFGGHPTGSRDLFKQSKSVAHVALSLTGEPITYPKFNELCRKFHERGISTFVVTNAQYPDAIKNLSTVTQLYLSMDAPNKEILKRIDKPLFPDYWERMMQSLEYCKEKKYRTAVRLTIVKGINDVEPENYAELILKADPDFVEIKGYMFVGASRQVLHIENMPYHEEVKAFGLKVLEYLSDYEFSSEHTPSRVILLSKKKYNKKTWIDFDKFFKHMNVVSPPDDLNADQYTTKTEKVEDAEIDEMNIDA